VVTVTNLLILLLKKGDLDDVAPILTNFFLLTYCLVNLACFLLVTYRQHLPLTQHIANITLCYRHHRLGPNSNWN